MNIKMIGMLLLGLAAGYASGCRAKAIEHVAPDVFQAMVAEGQKANSAHWVQAIGSTSSRA